MVRLSYLLLLQVKNDIKVLVGSLGYVTFKKGYYIYVGSGGKNVLKRLERHFSKKKKIKWHIDYLTSNDNVQPLFSLVFTLDEKELAIMLSKQFKFIKNFGSTDDKKAPSHLFYIGNKLHEKELIDLIKQFVV